MIVCTYIQTDNWGVRRWLQWFERRHKKALYEALEKIKGGNDRYNLTGIQNFKSEVIDIYIYFLIAELMVLGFISLLLTFGQNYIAGFCIPEKYADTMLPCPIRRKDVDSHHDDHHGTSSTTDKDHSHRRLLWDDDLRRILAADSAAKACKHVSTPSIFLSFRP